MSIQKPASTYPKTIAKPKSPDESQTLTDKPRIRTWYKGTMTRSHIYERTLPDDQTKALRIQGPDAPVGAAAIVQTSLGQIKLITGRKDKESGPGSGKLCVHSWGYQAKHENRADIQFNAGDDGEGQALNVVCYGDYVEQSVGSSRYIRAKKILIEATEELMLVGKTQVNIQSGTQGGGAIIMNAANIETTASNVQELLLGQKISVGVSEDTKVSFDPRASANIVSPGHINWTILGDYKQWIGGVEQHIVAGAPMNIPLIKARDSTYSVKTAIGGQTYDSADFISSKAGLAYDVKAGLSITEDAGLNFSAKAGGIANITALGAVNIKGALILLN